MEGNINGQHKKKEIKMSGGGKCGKETLKKDLPL